jgi:hypothetical protein
VKKCSRSGTDSQISLLIDESLTLHTHAGSYNFRQHRKHKQCSCVSTEQCNFLSFLPNILASSFVEEAICNIFFRAVNSSYSFWSFLGIVCCLLQIPNVLVNKCVFHFLIQRFVCSIHSLNHNFGKILSHAPPAPVRNVPIPSSKRSV